MHACARRLALGALLLPLLPVALGTVPTAATAQEATARDAPPKAVRHYRQGRRHFRAGRYPRAIVELERALELDPGAPNLLYNLAYTHELLGDLDEAEAYYARYLRALPRDAKAERRKARQTLRRVRKHREQVRAGEITRGDQDAGRADAGFWLTLGAGGALLTAGTATAVLAIEDEDAVATRVLLVSGGVAITAATLLYFLRSPAAAEQAARAPLTLATDGRNTQLTLRATF